MDPYAQNAYSRIRLFLADLNLVLGSPSYATPSKPVPVFNQIVCPQNLALRGTHQQLRSKRPTNRSRAWKMNHKQNDRDRLEKAARPMPPIHSVTQCELGSNAKAYTFRFPLNRRQDNVYSHRECYRPIRNTQDACHIQQPHQVNSFDYPNNTTDNHLSLEPSSNTMIEDQEIACGSENVMYETHELDEIDLDEIEWDDRSDLDINAAPHQFHPEQLVTPEAIPEESVNHSTQQPELDFDLKNYSANDVNRWANTLSAEEFKHLRIMGPDTRTESFRQYAISNLDRPTQTLSSSTHEHLDQPVLPSIGDKDNSDYHHHQPDDVGGNNFDQQQLATPDDESRSTFYNHSDDCNSHLEAFDNGGFDDSGFDDGSFNDSGFDNGGFDDSGFDDGGFDDSGFDDGGFDDGGFDDGGFDDGGFDDGGFDDGGFDGGFDDGYGSTY